MKASPVQLIHVSLRLLTLTSEHATERLFDCFSSFVDPMSSEVGSFDHAAQSAPEVRRALVAVVQDRGLDRKLDIRMASSGSLKHS